MTRRFLITAGFQTINSCVNVHYDFKHHTKEGSSPGRWLLAFIAKCLSLPPRAMATLHRPGKPERKSISD